MKSLLQQLCALLCSSDRTTQYMKEIKPKLRSHNKARIEQAMEPYIRDLACAVANGAEATSLGFTAAAGSRVSLSLITI